ncbi:MAG: hypothetical protein E8D40_15075 [Nitrospira sp.]|nr:MAG: hypothetical protein E8D40_15075 [Nitrospira sp.]
MGLLNRLFGFRWSLYVVHNGGLAFAMHEHSVMSTVGYVMSYFAAGKEPVAPWELYLNFNHKHQTIKLTPAHFTVDGENVTPLLIQQIEAIDPGWKIRGGEPVFEEAATKKKLKISDAPRSWSTADLQAMMDNLDKPRELTFFSVMDMVFGKR